MTRDEHVRDLSKTGLSCMLTYFKFSNLSLGKLRLNDDVDYDCEVVSSDVNKLEGWSLLWNVALNARDEDAANLAIRFVVHTIAPADKYTLSEFWAHCTMTCVKHLKTSHRQNENTTTSRRVRRCVVALQLLLKNSAQESKGRMKSHEQSCLHSGGDGDNLVLPKIRNNVKESPQNKLQRKFKCSKQKRCQSCVTRSHLVSRCQSPDFVSLPVEKNSQDPDCSRTHFTPQTFDRELRYSSQVVRWRNRNSKKSLKHSTMKQRKKLSCNIYRARFYVMTRISWKPCSIFWINLSAPK